MRPTRRRGSGRGASSRVDPATVRTDGYSAAHASLGGSTVTRRSAAQTRQLLLDTAIGMYHELGARAGVSHVRLSDVVRRAGLTTGAAYRLWDDQSAFHTELAREAIRWRDRNASARTIAAIRPIVESRAPVEEMIRCGAEANLYSAHDNEAFLATLALRAAAWGTAELMDVSRERMDESLAEFEQLYIGLLEVYGRRMREPFTTQHLTLALSALTEGFGIHGATGVDHPRVEIPSDDPRVGRDWSLFGAAAWAIVDHMTEPVSGPASGPGDAG